MSDAVRQIADRVRDRVRREGTGDGSAELAAAYAHEEVRRHAELALGGLVPLLPDEREAEAQVVPQATADRLLTLRATLTLAATAAVLNAEGLATATGALWTENAVGKVQKRIESAHSSSNADAAAS